jgi:hypothetical protein
MSNPRDKYGVDRLAEKAGAPVVFDEWEFILRSASNVNREYRYGLGLLYRNRRDELLALGESPQALALQDDLQMEAFARYVAVGWKNVTNGHGAPLEFTPENMIALLRDCPQLWDELKDAAANSKRFPLTKEDGDQLGKS